jgi:hypothetical protein
MAQNFLPCDREQVLLMPPSLREWLPEGHFAWFVLAAVEEMDLSASTLLTERTAMVGRRMTRR